MKRPPYLSRRVTRHGKVVWYFWRGEGHKLIRLRAEYGSQEFSDQYAAALSGSIEEPKKTKETPETIAWLIARYRETSVWAELSAATKKQRENIFARLIRDAGNIPYREVNRASIVATRDAKRDTPAAANNFMKTMRGLFRWALEASLIDIDPTAGVKGVKLKNTGGFQIWSRRELEAFEARWPIGSRERLAYSILLYTGLRRGDAARLGRQHIRDGVIQIQTEKTNTTVIIPVLPTLQAVIDASPKKDMSFIGMTKESFGNWFKEACVKANVKGSAHGLRKAGAAKAAEEGATVHELNAIFGWTGTKMASLYTEKADRARMARKAMHKLENK